jgi:ATP-independent RNA helicase DbpA
MKKSFEQLPLKKELLENLKSLDFIEMTPIQSESLPIILKGNDIIAQAKTGSGKTAAFGLPILNQINTEVLKLHSLILCPTRELAEQVAEETRRLGRMIKNLKVGVICGGAPEYPQLKSIEHGLHIIVATPGRLLKFLQNRQLKINEIKILVLDEADRMLDMGFRADIDSILAYTSRQKQTLLFSATFPDEIEDLSRSFQKNPEMVNIDSQHEQNIIRQIFIEVENHQSKLDALLKVMNEFRPESSLIFCKTKQLCEDVAQYLNRQKIHALPFHGDLDQFERNVVLTKFSNKSALVLVATDVAARGLDIKELKAVINFDLAYDPEVYTHRIGRSGRAGQLGLSISLFVPFEKEKVEGIENYLNIKKELLDLDSFKNTNTFNLKAPMTTIYITAGKKDKLRPGDVVGAIIGETKLEAKVVGDINILPTQTYVAIETKFVSFVLEKLALGKVKGKKVKVGLA